jgi:hypothetical protein
MSHLSCPECKLVVRWTLETDSGFCPRCLARKKTAVVMERAPLKLLRGPEAAGLRDNPAERASP